MAYYHENLQYHEDTVKKRAIAKDGIKFLKELQTELNTQDNLGQADPRFWVIKGSEKIFGIEDGYEDGANIFLNGEVHATDMQTAHDYLQALLAQEYSNRYAVNINKGICCFSIDIQDKELEEFYELNSMKEVCEWLEEYVEDDYTCVNYKIVDKIYHNTMFLTQKDAEAHLRANSHHYSEDAHTYAMTAWRNPRMEKLIKLLQEIDWEEEKCE